MGMTVLLAALAAVVYGMAVAAQHHEAASIDPAHSLRPRLLLGLAVRPLWLLGLVGDLGGFALQTTALTVGSVVVVQPILTLSLVVSLLIGVRLDGSVLQRRDWAAVAGTLVGLAVFLVVARPSSHSDAVASTARWLLTLGAVALPAMCALALGRAMAGPRRGMCFAVAAACAEAVMAVLAKAFGDRLGHGVWRTFTSWQPYAVVGCGVIILVLVQSAYQVGEATATLPVLTVTEPIVAIALGAVLFGERVDLTGGRAPIVVLAIALMGGSLAVIASRRFSARAPGSVTSAPRAYRR